MKRKAISIASMRGEHLGDMLQVIGAESPLPLVLILAAVVDNALMTLLHAFFIESKTTESMFGIRGELDGFSKCTRMAYCLGLVSKSSFENLNAIGSIRNHFAHKATVMNFVDPDVVALCKKLTKPPIGVPDSITPYLGFGAKVNTAASYRAMFCHVCLCLSNYLLHAADTTTRAKLMDEEPLWVKVRDHFNKGIQQLQQKK